MGFEPTKPAKTCWFSRPVHSTTLPPLRFFSFLDNTIDLALYALEPVHYDVRPVHHLFEANLAMLDCSNSFQMNLSSICHLSCLRARGYMIICSCKRTKLVEFKENLMKQNLKFCCQTITYRLSITLKVILNERNSYSRYT